jgi:hypothetical protein
MASSFRVIPVAAALAIGACASPNAGIDVKRFHLGTPVTRGTIAVVPANSAQASGLEYRSYADAVANELRAQGFTPVGADAGPAYVGTLTITQNVSVGPRRPSGFSIGIGGGGFSGGRGGGIGLGGGASFPVGKSRGDQALVWEGSASTAIDTRSPQASLANAVPAMARALLAGFPGPSGVTQHVPLK